MRRRWRVPEVVATSAMDCGPAALQALAAALGLRVDHGALRESCATDTDGTSIDRLETVGRELGLHAVQRLVPIDWLWLRSARCLPAIVVTRVAEGATHFVVVWRTLGPWVQVMDPAVGRLWVRRRRFERDLYRHTMDVPEPAWRAWVESDDFRATLDERRRRLRQACNRGSGMAPEHNDAALRLVAALVDAGLLSADRIAAALRECAKYPHRIPPAYWFGRAHPSGQGTPTGDATVRISGVIVLSCRSADRPTTVEGHGPTHRGGASAVSAQTQGLRFVLREIPKRPVRAALLAAVSVGTVLALEPLLARAAIVALPSLVDAPDRRTAALSMLVLWGIVGWQRWSLEGHARAIGRALHERLRAGFREAVDRLDDRYFRTRLLTDLALRVIGAHRVRALPLQLAGMAVSMVAMLALAILAVAVAPPASVWVALMVAGALTAPLWAAPLVRENEHRMRQAGATLARATREAFLGQATLRSAQGRDAMLAALDEHERRWRIESHARDRIVRRIDTLVSASLMLSVPAAVHRCMDHDVGPGTALLVAVMLAAVGALARDWVVACCALPWSIDALRKASEPLSECACAGEAADQRSAPAVPDGPLAVSLRAISVREGDRAVLTDINLDVRAGEHVAVVGESGSGKSTLLDLLTGAVRPAEGVLQVGGESLEGGWLRAVNRRSAWFDGSAYLFDRTCRSNLEFGSGSHDPGVLIQALQDVDLLAALATRKLGLESLSSDIERPLSDSELRRLRIARSLRHRGAGLVIADEPTRGLDRRTRPRITDAFRSRFRNATMFFATHDLDAASRFDRVVVLREGRIVESGDPARLRDDPGSAFTRLLAANAARGPEDRQRTGWRSLRLDRGRLRDHPACET